jgi:sigma-B regulation protein RsbU (phosphoserine phosphatase)
MFGDTQYEEYSIQLRSGDRLYFYSDGITEARNKQDTMLETEGLMRFIEEADGRSVAESVSRVIDRLSRCYKPLSFADDVSLLALELPA